MHAHRSEGCPIKWRPSCRKHSRGAGASVPPKLGHDWKITRGEKDGEMVEGLCPIYLPTPLYTCMLYVAEISHS